MSVYPPNTTTPKSGNYVWNWLGTSLKKFAEVLSTYLPSSPTPTLEQVLTAGHDLTTDTNFQGSQAGDNNTGYAVVGLGFRAAINNTGVNVNALGAFSAENNTADDVNALGQDAAKLNENSHVNALGRGSCSLNKGRNVNGLGANAGSFNEGNHVNAFGDNSCTANLGNHVNAFGENAGLNNKQSNRTIFSNDSLPEFATYLDAENAILGSPDLPSFNCTYLFYNSTTKTIQAVRL